jgi:DNA-binding response OmpR family regulator
MKNQILFVDDEPHILSSLRRLLRDYNQKWEMAFVSNVDDAIKTNNEKNFDVIISDIKMPQKDGFELLKELRGKKETNDIPIVMLTGLDDKDVKRKALDLGATDLLNKPINLEELIARVNNSLRLKSYMDEIKEFNSTLTNKVEERTRELMVTNSELKRAKEKAETANHAKSAFLATMSHELRTPLNAVIGYSEILEDVAIETNCQEYFVPDLKKINDAGKHLLKLINDILDISKIEAGKMELFIESCNVSNLVEEVVSIVQPNLDKNHNSLTINMPNDLKELSTDVTKLKQILLNLLNNATKFTHEGKISLDVTKARSQGENWVYFKITDTGIGMTLDQMSKLFQNFSQADSSTTRKYGGTGLGLAISKKFAQLMGGDISVQSKIDKGSAFTIKIPISEKILFQTDDIELPIYIDSLPNVLENPSVLVIDDDPVIQDLMMWALSKKGYQYFASYDGIDGIKRAKELLPSVIVLDIQMPEMDGWNVLTKLKEDSELSKIPVIILSMIDDKNKGYSLGTAEYLLKPIDRNQLNSVLKKYLDERNCSEILIIDDDPQQRELLGSILEKNNFNVREAENGKIGFQKITEKQPDLIILDLMMPEMDGFELLNKIDENFSWQSIPIIVLSAKYLTNQDRLQLNNRVQKLFTKGLYSPDKLIDQIISLISQNVFSNSK